MSLLKIAKGFAVCVDGRTNKSVAREGFGKSSLDLLIPYGLIKDDHSLYEVAGVEAHRKLLDNGSCSTGCMLRYSRHSCHSWTFTVGCLGRER